MDTNDDELIDVSDCVSLLSTLLDDGPMPPEPFLNCGEDLTEGALGCDAFPACNP